MSTVLTFDVSATAEEVGREVERVVGALVSRLRISHTLFEDPDFGPFDGDEYGAKALYGLAGQPGSVGLSKYPAPENLRWERPVYDDENVPLQPAEDDTEEDDEFAMPAAQGDDVFCSRGRLFVDGSSSGDVIQGILGDCWFLSALAVLGTREDLLKKCFWRLDGYKESGLFVCTFHKDLTVKYVIIDDRLPVSAKTGRLVFATCKDPNELWVPLIEKAYAKLHGSYGSLIKGYSHFGLGDLTGLSPRMLVLRPGVFGFSEETSAGELWTLLASHADWGSLMGCSIQAAAGREARVEAEAGEGLHTGHAYSLLAIAEINLTNGSPQKLVKLRNPWGKGEWTGAWSDMSEEYLSHASAIEGAFKDAPTEADAQDGTFLMTFEDWRANFNALFMVVDFPSDWSRQRFSGRWDGGVGGSRKMTNWKNNPKVRMFFPGTDGDHRQVFIGLYINDTRLTLGGKFFEDPLYRNPLVFDVIEAKDLDQTPDKRATIPTADRPRNQPAYNFGTTQVEVSLKVNVEYLIVPSLHAQRQEPGVFYLDVHADCTVFILGAGEGTSPVAAFDRTLERAELVRDRLTQEVVRLGLTAEGVTSLVGESTEGLTKVALKRRLLDAGFNIVNFPDEDLDCLDKDGSGTIDCREFINFVGLGLQLAHDTLPPPPPLVDDLQFQTADLDGLVTIEVQRAKSLLLESALDPIKVRTLKYNPDYRPEPVAPINARKSRRHSTNQPKSTMLLPGRSQRSFNMSEMDMLEFCSPRDPASASQLSESDGRLIEQVHSAQDLAQSERKRSTSLARRKVDRLDRQREEPKEVGTLRVRALAVSRPDIEKDVLVQRFLSYKKSLLGPESAHAIDLWDELVDRVILVSESRTATSIPGLLKIMAADVSLTITSEDQGQRSPRSKRTMLGSLPTPLNMRTTPGTASVTGTLSRQQQSGVLRDARNELLREEPTLQEVWQRLVVMPVAGQGVPLLVSTFQKQDKSKRGLLSPAEVRLSFRELGVDLSEDDVGSLTADSESCHVTDLTALIARVSRPSQYRPLLDILCELREKLSVVLREMRVQQLYNIEDYLVDRASARTSTVASANDMLPSNALLSGLQDGLAGANSGILARLGLCLSEEEMRRVSRAFSSSLDELTAFLHSSEELKTASLEASLSEALLGGLSREAFARQWASLCADSEAVSVAALEEFLLGALLGQRESVTAYERLVRRTLIDQALCSVWNTADVRSELLSRGAVEALLRPAHLEILRRRLLFVAGLAAAAELPTVALLMHAYVSMSRDRLLLVAKNPFSGKVISLLLTEDVSFLKPEPGELLTPSEYPAADKALADLVMRLRLLQTGSSLSLILAEDGAVVGRLRDALEAASLPFFFVINDAFLAFEIDSLEHEGKSTTLRKLVFSAIRHSKALFQLMLNLGSSLSLRLSTYDGNDQETISWVEMQAHLRDYRNPFVTVELFPKQIPVEEYVYRPTVHSSAFTGDEESRDKLAAQRGATDDDGASQPEFTDVFSFDFSPPKLSSCPVLSTEIARMIIDGVTKYIIVILRQGPRGRDGGFLFLTAYDSRTSTEYQCGAREDSQLAREMYGQASKGCADQRTLEDLLAQAADAGDLLLGPPITPRLVVSVFNSRGRIIDQLGSCEVSISSILCGSGGRSQRWVKLLSEGRDSLVGEVQCALAFRRRKDLENERQSRVALRKSRDEGFAGAVVQAADKPIKPLETSGLAPEDFLSSAAPEPTNIQCVEPKPKVKVVSKEEPTPRMDGDRKPSMRPVVDRTEEVQGLQKQVETLKREMLAFGEVNKRLTDVRKKEDRSLVANEARSVQKKVETPASTQEEEKMPELVTDESLEGLVGRLIATFSSRKDPKLSALVRLLRGTASSDMLSSREVYQCLEDLRTGLNQAHCDVLLRHVGLSSKGVSMRALTDFLGNMHKITLSDQTTPKGQRKPESATKTKANPPAQYARKNLDRLEDSNASINVQVEMQPQAPASPMVDWSSQPLPENWERRMDPRTNRFYYLNHLAKGTQWYHPQDPRGRRTRAIGSPSSTLGSTSSPKKSLLNSTSFV